MRRRGDANFLNPLCKLCTGNHTHIGLSGWKPKDKNEKVMRPTKGDQKPHLSATSTYMPTLRLVKALVALGLKFGIIFWI